MNPKEASFHFATKAIHAGFHHDNLTGAVMPPIYLASTFAQKSPGKPISHYEYSRTANPTRDILQANLAALENGQFCLCFASGCAALGTLLHSFPPGSHVIIGDDVYGGTLRIFANIFSQYEIHYTQCDTTHLSSLESAFTPNTRLIWIETPSNPLLKISDISKVAELKQQIAPDALLGVDNTFATPFLQNPLDLGADLVCHSTTKYIGGHSDIVGGALIFNDEALMQKLTYIQNAFGAVPSPMDCYLLLRSIKTLAVRMQAHCHNAMKIATFLNDHPQVQKVIYPGLETHPQHILAKHQMRDFGGMISAILKGTKEETIRFLEHVKLFTLAESLGGVESLIEHPTIMTHASIPPLHRQKIGIEDTLVRLSIGIEDPNDLIADLAQALGSSHI